MEQNIPYAVYTNVPVMGAQACQGGESGWQPIQEGRAPRGLSSAVSRGCCYGEAVFCLGHQEDDEHFSVGGAGGRSASLGPNLPLDSSCPEHTGGGGVG